MRTCRSPEALRREVRRARAAGQRIGFVPTMGYLHEGHLSLVRRARGECDLLAASIFVNPLQFGPGEDFTAYPRSEAADRRRLRLVGVDLLYLPRRDELYPPDFSTTVSVGGLSEPLCGAFRPGHFSGVATVVMKLLAAAEPDRLYLGQKDYQQALILRRMARDLDLPVRIVIGATVREPDGLAMSSRNAYLTPEERAWAPALYRTLRGVAGEIGAARIRTPKAAGQAMVRELKGGPGQLQYASVLGAGDLQRVDPLSGDLVLALAYLLGRARLIDNVLVTAPGSRRPAEARRPAGAGRAAHGSRGRNAP